VDREILGKAMRERGVREGLVIRRCEDILRETKSRIRTGEKVSEAFWRGVRQGCPLSPGIYLTDLLIC